MKKVYQRISDPKRGDCFKCTICTLLGLDYDDVPNFVELEGEDAWWLAAVDVFKEHGYKLTGQYLYNPNACFLENPTFNVYEEQEPPFECTMLSIKPEYGINGLFMASVYSPKYTNPNEHPIEHLHSVLCDINFNIVFDPQPEYEKVVNYPYSKIIGYNGIRGIDKIIKI